MPARIGPPSPYPESMIFPSSTDDTGLSSQSASVTSYWVQEEDGSSRWIVEEGGGFWLTEESA